MNVPKWESALTRWLSMVTVGNSTIRIRDSFKAGWDAAKADTERSDADLREARRQALDELAAESQRLGLYDMPIQRGADDAK